MRTGTEARLLNMNKTQRTKALLARGYFPKELPPPFSSATFATKIAKLSKEWERIVSSFTSRQKDYHPRASLPVVFDMARRGHARRQLSIPNPINQFYLCDCLSNNWSAIKTRSDVSAYSLTRNEISAEGARAVPMPPFSDLPEHRVKAYAAQQTILSTDISSFYHSIYTHSIPWALHGKSLAKRNRRRDDKNVFGNMIDFLVMQCQDGQTKGIPVGPDTSRVISEVILSAVDEAFHASVGGTLKSGFRYIDDMFYCFTSSAEAEKALSILKSTLREYELEVNSTKTKVQNALEFNEEVWPYVINRTKIEHSGEDQKRSLAAFFAFTIQTAKENPHESISNYALKYTTKYLIDSKNWDLYEAFLIRTARESTNSIDVIVKIIATYVSIGREITPNVQSFINATIIEHAPLGHHFEVSWVLWLALSLKVELSPAAVDALSALPNSVCCLLGLHLYQEGLLSKGMDVSGWLGTVTSDSLFKEHWLLVYEAGVRGWLGQDAADAVRSEPFFFAMQNAQVSFYNDKAFNRPLKVPGIEFTLASKVRAQRNGWLPGRVYFPKRKSEQTEETYESLGADYGDDEVDDFYSPFTNDDED
jgi:Reverse transcriptase (RNA-dependent DNA polymerase)